MLTFKIALRYLFSKKSHHVVNIISAVSIAGVAVATMAIVVVLSVFNGFTGLSQQQLSKTDPDLLVSPAAGKIIVNADSLAEAITSLNGVIAAVPTIEERAMLISRHSQMPVIMKAVGDGYCRVLNLEEIMIDGIYVDKVDTNNAMQISVGVANRTGLRPGLTSIAELYVPRRQGRINPANPAAAFRNAELTISGVLQSDQADVDIDRVIVPLSVARRLLDYGSEASAIEISVAEDFEAKDLADKINKAIGDGFKIEDRYMQQEESFRMIEIEKWVTFMMLVFILIIASFNIVSTLSLLVAEKRGDMSTFRALGASKTFIKNVFIWQGFLITMLGGLIGIVTGIVLSLLQEHFGLIKLSGDPSTLTIDVYPVAVEFTDIIVVLAAILIVAAITSQITRIFTKNIK